MIQQSLFNTAMIDPAEEAARQLIRHYVKRGDDPKWIRSGHGGSSCPNGMSAQIGGWCDPFEEITKNKQYSTEHIIVTRDINGKRVCRIFKFQDIYEAIKAK